MQAREHTTTTRLLVAALVGAVAAAVLGTDTATGAPGGVEAPVSGSLARQLGVATNDPVAVLIHGTDLAAANRAITATGMTRMGEFARIGVSAALATPNQIAAARAMPGVTYVEGDQPVELFTATSHRATRGAEARQTLVGADGLPLDGSGVSVAVIDSGVDPNHPSFRTSGGDTRVVRNLKAACLGGSALGSDCVVDVTEVVDTDTLSVGGHGTHVTGIAAGGQVTLADGTQVSGAAPGAKIVSISTGAVLFIIGADAALNWILENHRAPCGAIACPPIKVVNNSYGPSGGGSFDPRSATAKLQRALVAEGVVVVWANGNDGGDGSANHSNPAGQDPTPGVVSVASYYDQDTGTRDGVLSTFSSRGLAGDSATWPDISAPGQNIISSCRPYLLICSSGRQPLNGPGPLDVGTFNSISGTSMAAPHIAGIVAQLFQAAPQATAAEIEHALKSTAYQYTFGASYQPAGDYPSSFDKGTGLVDVVAAAKALGAVAAH